MGQVYRATDTKLKRQVAIKILPPSVAADHDRLARFEREAEVLASLNHPNIAGIYGLEESGGATALVMELVEGDDLSQRIARGAIPIDEALPIARQIAEALEAAHEQGIIHRDLKPANVKVRADGVVKVLDFGLAKALEPVSAGSTDAATSPTITSPAMMTRIGVILGTADYMAPEQAKGRVADKRCDVWAFGCVLYEMLEGKRVFDGEDVSDTLASVLTREPDWSALPATTPPAMVTLLKRCLERDRRKRVPDMAAVRFLLDDALAASAPSVVGPAAAGGSPQRPRWQRALPVVATALAAAGVTAVTAWWLVRASPAATPRPVRFSIVPPPSQSIGGARSERIVAISPDGSHFVYVSAAGSGRAPPARWSCERSIDSTLSQSEASRTRGHRSSRRMGSGLASSKARRSCGRSQSPEVHPLRCAGSSARQVGPPGAPTTRLSSPQLIQARACRLSQPAAAPRGR